MTDAAALPVPLFLPPGAMAELAEAKAVLDHKSLVALCRPWPGRRSKR